MCFPVKAPENFLSVFFLTFVLDTPEKWEIIRRQLAGLLHRRLTSPPSLWPGCELQKYHYPCMPSWPCRLQSDISKLAEIARLQKGESWRAACPALAYGNVPDEWVFSCQVSGEGSSFSLHEQV